MTRGVLRCNCGKEFEANLRGVERENLGCGCRLRRGAPKHGNTSRYGTTPTYSSWKAAKARCYNSNNKHYYRYGGDGIKMCDRWINSFENFLLDMGERPEGHTLDRFPNKRGNYEPENCRWATKEQQVNNMKSNVFLTKDGETMTMAQWGRKLGIPKNTIYGRIKRGYSAEEALVIGTKYAPKRKNAA